MNNGNNNQPEPVDIRRDRSISPLWLLPILAFALAGWLVFKAVNDAGQRIQIHFNDAAGLIAGRTTIRYQGLEVGIVRDINLSDDLESIYVEADIYPEAVQTLNTGTRFWLVKPKASITGISGLDALVSGNYIALQPGEGEATQEFIALDSQPSDTPIGAGLSIQLRAPDLGSISIGSQVFYKKIPVGEVYNYTLSENNKRVLIDVLIQPQYANLVTNKSRFWNVSGMSANINFNGVDVQFESLSAMIAGAIAFDSPDEGLPIDTNHLFRLYPDLNTAGRGIAIKIELPENSNVSGGGAPIVYRGLQIGQISDVRLDENRNKVIAHAAVEPSMSDLLTSGSSILLEEAEVSLTGVKNIGNLIRGNYLTLIPGEGQPSRQFKAITQDELQENQQGVATFSLYADSSHGVKRGTKILHRGIEVGRVTKVFLDKQNVRFNVIVKAEYRSLIGSASRFFIDGGIKANISSKGLDVSLPPAEQLISTGISFTSGGSKKIAKEYPLYKSESLAQLASDNAKGFANYTLVADELPPVSEGSPVLYRNLQVGEVTRYALTSTGISVSLKIENRYRHLVKANTVFWNRSGVEVEAGLGGVKITASPVATLIKGGIAFDEIDGVSNKQNGRFKIYSSLSEARNFGQEIHLSAKDARSLAVGTEIRYHGIAIGKVTEITPDFESESVDIKARLFPKFAHVIARAGSYFWIVKPKLSLTETKNLDSLLSSYISVTPGKGIKQQTFALGSAELVNAGLTLVLESEKRNSISEGTPLLYRDIQVGQVVKVSLGDLSDRVMIEAQIEQEYSHLVRKDTVFWNVSGFDVSIGITGATVNSGTVDSLIRGGIAFATPEKHPLAPIAKQNTHFLLNKSAKPEWKEWRTAIPRD
ncbi:paraquat-inducible protein B [Photobacterium jeanii]|uniref:Paraquat-inducible protein B n=1 Tax=Photobacterium jeanii TaxID=858640 RepID=A0A178KK94_9GAMM|nr:MlaD family protein [Photobacterium jeanii]OAN17788.1 paraquat-inducible protein B [Photobacterium jeanii]PST92546.1 MCE family protein [Photobacterium jeanii]